MKKRTMILVSLCIVMFSCFFSACNFTLNDNDGVPYFEEARLVINCKKLYADMLKADCFLDGGEAIEKHYTTHGGLHKLYIAEIEGIFVKED